MVVALPVRRGNDRRPHTAETGSWEPLAERERLSRQLAAQLDSWRQLPSVLGDAFVPLADVEETAEAYLVEIELPGVKKPDLDIEIAGRRMVVAGERKERQRRGILRTRERTVGRFQYEVTFPGDVDESNIEANLDEGVLSVRVPKPERDRPRRIEVR
jgi:HSP20 family protein